MSEYQYVRDNYGVPACHGRRVVVHGEPGVICEDRGHYIGVNFDKDKPGVIKSCHPKWRVEYQDIRKVRKTTKSQRRYAAFLDYGDYHDSFIDFCYWYDSQPGLK